MCVCVCVHVCVCARAHVYNISAFLTLKALSFLWSLMKFKIYRSLNPCEMILIFNFSLLIFNFPTLLSCNASLIIRLSRSLPLSLPLSPSLNALS